MSASLAEARKLRELEDRIARLEAIVQPAASRFTGDITEALAEPFKGLGPYLPPFEGPDELTSPLIFQGQTGEWRVVGVEGIFTTYAKAKKAYQDARKASA